MTDHTITEIKPIVPTIKTTADTAAMTVSPKAVTTSTYVPPPRLDTSSFPVLDTDTLPDTPFWQVLGTALTMRRDYGSMTESSFVAWLSNYLGGADFIDASGNLHFDRRLDKKIHRTMFCAHTDTVHLSGGHNVVRVDGKFWRADTNTYSALGADDGSGIAILAHLMSHKVPGYYVFFRGEECGGIGSSWAAENLPNVFREFDRAIAFDRADYSDIITHQRGGVCCSDAFAQALCDQLLTDELWYLPCAHGVYTDTAEFIDLIPECTNISVGYRNQHGDREQQDVDYLAKLADQAVLVKWDELPTVRKCWVKPKHKAYKYTGTTASTYARSSTGIGSGSSLGLNDDGEDEADAWTNYRAASAACDERDRELSEQHRASGSLFDDEEDEEEDCLMFLMETIDQARRGAPRDLYDLMAEAAYPEDPDMARKMIDPNKVTGTLLDVAEGMVDEGNFAGAVALFLFDSASRAT